MPSTMLRIASKFLFAAAVALPVFPVRSTPAMEATVEQWGI